MGAIPPLRAVIDSHLRKGRNKMQFALRLMKIREI
jgi:hypothetical protein